MHDDAQQQPLRVHRDVALASRDLLGRVVTARTACFRCFHALAVDDRGRGAWLPPCRLTQQDHKLMAHALPHARAEERTKVAIHGRPGQERRRRGQVPPLATRSAAGRTSCPAGAACPSCAAALRAWQAGSVAATAAIGHPSAPDPTRNHQPTHDHQGSTSQASRQPNRLKRNQDAPRQTVTPPQSAFSNGV